MPMHTQVFKLAQFEGPLDLLLHLIQKAKIDLQDVFVSEITEQYLRYMEQIDEIDMDRASDFLNMAAMLLYIKSRSLLPAQREFDGEEGEDPEAELIEKLRAYKVFKEAGGMLREMQADAQNIFFKLPEEMFDGEQDVYFENVDADALYRAFLSILKSRKKEEGPGRERVEIRSDSFSIRRQKTKILGYLKNIKRVSFFRLFEEGASAMEVAVTFVALIELWHEGRVAVKQREAQNDITIKYVPGGEGIDQK